MAIYLLPLCVVQTYLLDETEEAHFSFDMFVIMVVVIWKCVIHLKYK